MRKIVLPITAFVATVLSAACVSSFVEGIATTRQMMQAPSTTGPVVQSVTFGHTSRLPTSIGFGPERRLSVAGVAGWAEDELDVSLTPGEVVRGPDGVTYLRFQQHYRGIPVHGTSMMARVEAGQVAELTGQVLDGIDANTSPRLSPDEAFAALNAQAPELLQYGDPHLVVLPVDDVFYLTYRLRTWNPSAGVLIAYYVDAGTAELRAVEPEFESVTAIGEGQTTDGRTVTFGTQHTSDIPPPEQGPEIVDIQTGFRLLDEERNLHTMSLGGATEITQFMRDSAGNLRQLWPYLPGHDLIEDDNIWEATPHAVDVHWGMAQAYDYYLSQHEWLGWDGHNSLLRAYVDYFRGYTRAFYSWARFLGFGDGGPLGRPLTTPDIVAHEYAHAVSDAIVDFSGWNEAGSINEAISDIVATHIRFTRGEGSWIFGADFPDDRLHRNLQNPKSMSFPDTYDGEFWREYRMTADAPITVPETHPHHNSLVMSHWFYLISAGDEGENDNEEEYDIDPIGIDKAGDILFRSLFSVGSNATFKSTRDATIRETRRLYGKCSEELRQVTNAWNAVGVGPPACGCFEGSFDYNVESDDGRSHLKFFVRDEDFAVEVPTENGGTAVMYTTEGDPFRHVQGEPDYPDDPASNAARMLLMGRLPVLHQPRPLMKRKEYVEYRNRHRTGQRREMGEYTIHEYRMDRATIWATEDVCMDMTDWGAILTMRPTGMAEAARQTFFGFPVRFEVPGEGVVWIENLREHEVDDSYFRP